MKLNRSHKRPLEVTIGRADRDPMFTPAWYDGTEPLTPPTKPAQEPSPHWDLAPLPPLEQQQQNDHVMRYWDWRLDRIEAMRGISPWSGTGRAGNGSDM